MTTTPTDDLMTLVDSLAATTNDDLMTLVDSLAATTNDDLMTLVDSLAATTNDLDERLERLAAMRRHPTSFAAHGNDDAAVVPISTAPSYRARHAVRDQLGLGGRS